MDGNSVKGNRLMSLDALRGFDMLWIMGGEELICTIAALFGFAEFGKSFGHVPWEGLQFMDTVFPTFLFMAGASFPFSAAKSLERGMTRGQIALRALRRGKREARARHEEEGREDRVHELQPLPGHVSEALAEIRESEKRRDDAEQSFPSHDPEHVEAPKGVKRH